MINQRQQGRRRGRGGQRPQNNGGRGQDNGNRIDNRARGNAAQLLEKYKTMARDAQQAGDRVLTEYYLQFADHYFRVLADNRARFEEQQPRRDARFDGDQNNFDAVEGDEIDEMMADSFEARQPRQERQPSFDRDRPQRGDDHRRDGFARRPNGHAPEEDGGERSARAERPRREDRPQRPVRATAPNDDEEVAATLSADLLPPAITAASAAQVDDGDPADVAPAPKRRGRPRKAPAEALPEA